MKKYFENLFFFIYKILMYYLSLIIINFQNVPFYLCNFPLQEFQEIYFVKSNILQYISIKNLYKQSKHIWNLNSTF